MRNLKKLLAVITVVAIMATLFVIPASAASLSDVAGTSYESAVTRLNALGIITGRTDGKFYPNDTITRAEFAAVVVRSLGYASAADAAKGQTKFSDVKADFWASGYINLANSLGIIKGRPDGTFGADDKVLYEEAVTMIVRALGYEPAAAARGGYPTGYLTIASQEDVDKDAVSAIGAPASRGIVAKMVDNSLEVAMMIQVGYGTEQKFVKSGTENTDKQTLLDSKLKLDVRKANVTSVDLANAKIKVKMTGDASNGDDKDTAKTYKAFDSIKIAGLENTKVTLWVKDGVVYNLKQDTKVVYDFIKKINGKDNAIDNTYSLKDVNDITLRISGDTYDVALDSDGKDATYKLFVNNYDGTETSVDGTASDGVLRNKFAKIYLTDGKVSRIEVYDLGDQNVGIITKVEDDTLTLTRQTTKDKKITGIKDADKKLVVIDGKVATYADLKADMQVSYRIDGKNYVFVASSAKKQGKLELAKSGKVQIAGAYTDLANSKYYSNNDGTDYSAIDGTDKLSDLLGNNVVAYVNYEGKINYIKGAVEEKTTNFYGIVTNVNDFNSQIKVTRNVDGEIKTVTYDTDLTTTTGDETSASTFAQINTKYSANIGGNLKVDTATERKNMLYKLYIDSDNVVTKAKWIDVSTGMSDVAFKKDSGYIYDNGEANMVYTDSATILQINTGDVKLLKWADIKGTSLTAGTSGVDVYFDAQDDSTPNVILVDDTTNVVAFSTSDKYLGYVTSLARENSDDYVITMNTNSGSKTFVVDDGKLASAAEKRLVLYRTVSEEGRAEVAVSAATYSDLSALAGGDFAVVAATDVADNGVDGSTLKLLGSDKTYRMASDAVVYKLTGNARDTYTLSDISELDEDRTDGKTSTVTFVTYKGLVKYLFFWNN